MKECPDVNTKSGWVGNEDREKLAQWILDNKPLNKKKANEIVLTLLRIGIDAGKNDKVDDTKVWSSRYRCYTH